MRILHISDIHVSSESPDSPREIVEALLRDVDQQHRDVPIEAIVFTGDLAHAGKELDYLFAEELLLAPLLERLGLDRTALVLVPGNHDVNRDDINDVYDAGLEALLTTGEQVASVLSDPDHAASALVRLHNWSDFHALFYGTRAPESLGPLGFLHRITSGKAKVTVAALNSAWRARGGEGDRGRLLVGGPQISAALAATSDSDINIVALHHPLEWLKQFDADTVRDHVERRACIVLTGHEHVSNPSSEFSLRGAAIYGRVGCLYEHDTYPNTYALIDVDLASAQTTVTIRAWWPLRREWDEATHLAPHGSATFPMRAAGIVGLTNTSFRSVSASLANVARERGFLFPLGDASVTSVEDMIVGPRFLLLPYREAAAAAVEKGIRLQSSSTLDLLARGDTIVLTGERESGLTCALLHIIGEHFRINATHVPIYLSWDHRFDASRFARAAADALRRMGVSTDSRASLPPLVCAIDDLDTSNPKAVARLAKLIADRPNDMFILGCHGAEHAQIRDALITANVDHERRFLAPFSIGQLRELVRRASPGDTQAVVEDVLSLLGDHRLPRTPLVIVALITVIGRVPDLKAVNRTVLLDEYARLLLGAADIEDTDDVGLDYRPKEHLLSWLATDYTFSGTSVKPRADVENLIGRYFRERGWSAQISPGRVLEALLRRRILLADERGVGFVQPAFQDLFAAKMAVEDPEIAASFLRDTIRYAKVLSHAAALRRSDRQLLESVLQEAERLMKDLEPALDVRMFDRIEDDYGWSEDSDLTQLKAMLGAPQVGSPEYDERLDRIYEGLEAQRSNQTPEETKEGRQRLSTLLEGVNLLSEVLRGSELVDDIELKTKAMKSAVHGWGLLTVVFAVHEDQTERSRTLVRDTVEVSEGQDREALELLLRVLGLVLTLTFGMAAADILGSPKLERMIRNLVEDEDFMSYAAHGFVASLMYAALRLPDWVALLGRTYDMHRGHPLTRSLIRVLATHWYRSGRVKGADEQRLEGFLADIYTAGVRAGASIPDKARVRARVLTQLQASRRRGLSTAMGSDFDFLQDAEPGRSVTDA